MNNVIIGAGELGSRHLQGLLQFDSFQQIYVVDLSEDSLAVARVRAAEINHQHVLNFISDIALLPDSLDIVIVSTTSAVREIVVTQLLSRCKVRYLVLEKVLFQQIAAYERIGNLLAQHDVQTWVNHPRRMYPHYQLFKSKITKDKEAINLFVNGGNWGLGCNALHMIDLVAYINNSNVKFIDTSLIDDEIETGKRKGYSEFTGTVTGTLQNGAFFSITSFKGKRGALSLHFASPSARMLVQEGGTPASFFMDEASKFAIEQQAIQPIYQSGLTNLLASDLIKTGTCQLPTYREASAAHVIFIESLLNRYNQITGLKTDLCPIT